MSPVVTGDTVQTGEIFSHRGDSDHGSLTA